LSVGLKRMYLAHLELRDFRNYRQMALSLPAGVVVLHGPNGAGKTNLLEAVAVAATGDSPRARTTGELVRNGGDYGFVRADFSESERNARIEMGLAKTGQRRIKIEGVVRRRADLIGVAPVVLFWVEDMETVRGEPSGRRRLVDRELSAVRRPYYEHLSRYRRALEQRNRLLKSVREGRAPAASLDPWDRAAARHGARVMLERSEFISSLAPEAERAQETLTAGKRRLGVEYRPSVAMPSGQSEGGDGKEMAARVEEIAGNLTRSLIEQRSGDIRYGTTVCGPHRDDIELTLDGQPIRVFGSQGEQRSCALAMRLGLAAVVRRLTGQAPLLLLDDVLSELDERHRRGVFEACAAEQAIVTCCDLEDVPAKVRQTGAVLGIHEGNVV
jgi:DNA replication and repair protein RecF